MIKNYFLITLRNIKKYKLYSFINIFGLALALSCAFLILIWVNDELSYDQSFSNSSSIYRVNWDFKWQNNEGVGPGTPPPLAKSLLSDFPEISSATRIYPMPSVVVRYNSKNFNESKIFSADINFFSFFNYDFVEGNPSTALSELNSVILTEKTSKKYFGNESPIGKIILIGDNHNFAKREYRNAFKVTGVIKNPPHNSHIQFDMMTTINSNPEVPYFDWSWVWMQVVTYVKINNPSNISLIESKIPFMVKKYAPSAFKRVGFSYDEMIKDGGRWNFVFQPLKDIYLDASIFGNRLGPGGNRTYIYGFSIIAIFILFIACINFMNLATARSDSRTREIGIRKVLGSTKKMLKTQFMFESLAFSLIALILSIFIVALIITPFNNLTGKSLSIISGIPFSIFGSMFIITLFVGVVSGSYPAFYLSSLKPIATLKYKINREGRSKNYRTILVVFQFVITIALISSTILVSEQVNYIENKNIGFNKENIVVISNQNHKLGINAESFKNDILENPEIINAALTTGVPPNSGFQDYYKIEGKGNQQLDLISYMVDNNFVETMGIKIVKGRNFSDDFFTDSSNVIINEAAVKSFGWKNPLGKLINYPSKGKYKVIGVMKDFNFYSLYSPIQPFALFNESSKSYKIPDSFIVIRIKGNDLSKVIKYLESKWKIIAPETPFEYSFLDDNLNAEYSSEQRLGKVFLIFNILTIFIACIGLFGLVSFSIEKRTKEFGVRKVLGASVFNILSIVSVNIVKPIVIANIIAWPIAYYFMNNWLQDFAYRIDIGWWMFVLSGGIALLIALTTVSFQAVKAATANPVDSLKYE